MAGFSRAREERLLKAVSELGLVATPELAELALCRWGDDCFGVVTLRVDAATPFDDVQRVAQRVKGNGGIVEFAIADLDPDSREQLQSLRPWRILDDDHEYRRTLEPSRLAPRQACTSGTLK